MDDGSFTAIRDEVDRLIAEQGKRADNFDTKAGLLLGFCGVIVGFSPGDGGVLSVLAKVVAALAAGASVGALMPRVSGSVAPRYLREHYLHREGGHTRLRLLDTKILLYESDESRLSSKVSRLRAAVSLLVVAVLLLLIGSFVSAWGGGDDDAPEQWRGPTHRHAT